MGYVVWGETQILPVVVAARSRLGTLNHTALTVAALEERGIEVRAVGCNEYERATPAERTNPPVLERMTGVPIYTLSHADLADPSAAISLVQAHLPGSILGPVLDR